MAITTAQIREGVPISSELPEVVEACAAAFHRLGSGHGALAQLGGAVLVHTWWMWRIPWLQA